MKPTLVDVLALPAFGDAVVRNMDAVDAARVLIAARAAARVDVAAPLAAVAARLEPPGSGAPVFAGDARAMKIGTLRRAAKIIGIKSATSMPPEKLRVRVAARLEGVAAVPVVVWREIYLERGSDIARAMDAEAGAEDTIAALENGCTMIAEADALKGLALRKADLEGLRAERARRTSGTGRANHSTTLYSAADLLAVVDRVHGGARALKRRLVERDWKHASNRAAEQSPYVRAFDAQYDAAETRKFAESLIEHGVFQRPWSMPELYRRIAEGRVFGDTHDRERVDVRAFRVLREQALVEALRTHGIDLDDASRVCANYVRHGNSTLETVVVDMVEARFFREKTRFVELAAGCHPATIYDAKTPQFHGDPWVAIERRAEALKLFAKASGGVANAKRLAPATLAREIDELGTRKSAARKSLWSFRPMFSSPDTLRAATECIGGREHHFAARVRVYRSHSIWAPPFSMYLEVDSAAHFGARTRRTQAAVVAHIRRDAETTAWALQRGCPVVRVPEGAIDADADWESKLRAACGEAMAWRPLEAEQEAPVFVYPGSEEMYEPLFEEIERLAEGVRAAKRQRV